MSKLPFFLLPTLLASTSALAFSPDQCTAQPSCESMGYSKSIKPNCSQVIKCPFDISYKLCLDCNNEDMPQKGKCHIGDIYFENGTCKNKDEDWDLADNPIGVVFMLNDANGNYIDADSADHGRIIALKDAGTTHFGLCVPNNSYLSWLTHMISRQVCIDMTKSTQYFKNTLKDITGHAGWPDAPSQVSFSGQHPSCALSEAYGLDNRWTLEEGEDRCHDKGDGYDEPDDNCLNINEKCGRPAAIHMAFDYKGLGTENTATYPYQWKTYLMDYQNCGEWYLPSFYELLALMADNEKDLEGICPQNTALTGEMKERNILQKVNNTLWHLENETSFSATLDGKYWSASGVGGSDYQYLTLWVINIDKTKAALSFGYSNTRNLKVRPVARF